MPAGKAVRERDRLAVAAALTAQLVGGMAPTGIATYLVAIYLIPLGLPAFGAVVRDFAADLAAYNAPARMIFGLPGVCEVQTLVHPWRSVWRWVLAASAPSSAGRA
jgi:hypothetical protein